MCCSHLLYTYIYIQESQSVFVGRRCSTCLSRNVRIKYFHAVISHGTSAASNWPPLTTRTRNYKIILEEKMKTIIQLKLESN